MARGRPGSVPFSICASHRGGVLGPEFSPGALAGLAGGLWPLSWVLGLVELLSEPLTPEFRFPLFCSRGNIPKASTYPAQEKYLHWFALGYFMRETIVNIGKR